MVSEVFKARAKNDNKFVAMKRVLMENEKEGVSELNFFCFEYILVIGNFSNFLLVSDHSTS